MEDTNEDLLNTFTEVRECEYKGERYSVRDNGAIMRHAREGKRVRPMDNIWTFGERDEKTAYMVFSGNVRVHIVVAIAFHGKKEETYKNWVVDHIDTNRCNNRPENLRWCTRLENALMNEATRKRIEYLCGSIENFLAHPESLRDRTGTNQDLMWMRTVSSEEAKMVAANMHYWASRPNRKKPTVQEGQQPKTTDAEWMYKPNAAALATFDESAWLEPTPIRREEMARIKASMSPEMREKWGLDPTDPARSPSVARQMSWKTPTDFPCCPQTLEGDPIAAYATALKPGVVFCTNALSTSTVVDCALIEDGKALVVMTTSAGGMKPYALAKVFVRNGGIVHKSEGTFFEEAGARKCFALAQGIEWIGGDTFDDLC